MLWLKSHQTVTVQYILHYCAITERVSVLATDQLNYAAANSAL